MYIKWYIPKIAFLIVVTLTGIITSAHISLLDYQETDELSTEKQDNIANKLFS